MIKKKLLMSSTLPLGTGGASTGSWLMGSASHAHGHHHHHHADGSCYDHDHSHDHSTHDDSCDDDACAHEDHTSPKGGCC